MTITETAVRERPILFSGPMVRAILDGAKTQTRRVMSPQPLFSAAIAEWVWDRKGRGMEKPADAALDPPYGFSRPHWLPFCPYGAVGDRLWVRETWADSSNGPIYRAEPMFDSLDVFDWSWTPSIHMPRWASRISLEITDVRVQRLTEISEQDAVAEGYASRGEFLAGDWACAIDPSAWIWAISFRTLPSPAA